MHENGKPGDTRSLATLANRMNMLFPGRAGPLLYLHGKEGVAGSSPAEGFKKLDHAVRASSHVTKM